MPTTKKVQPVSTDTPDGQQHLTVKQMEFVKALLADKDFNGERAAAAAGYKDPKQTSYQMFKNKHVLKALGEAIHKRNTEYDVTAANVLRELAAIAFFNPQDALDPKTGAMLPLHRMPRHVAAAVSRFKVQSEKVFKIVGDDGEEEGETKEQLLDVRFHSKLTALEMLAKHVGLLKEVAPQVNLFQLDWGAITCMVGQRPPIQSLPSLDPVEQKIAAMEARALPPPQV